MRNKQASVLMISLWILSILVILAISLGHRAVISLKLARNQRDGLKAYLYAKSGIYKSTLLLKEDATGADTKDYDSISACGVNFQDKEPKTFFVQEFENETGNFTVAYLDSSGQVVYGMSDECGKININIDPANDFEKQVIIDLFTEYDIDEPAELVKTISTWINPSTTITIMSKAKKENFNLLEELLLVFEYYYREVKKDAPEDAYKKARSTYAKIKDSLRIAGNNTININTASAKIVTIFSSAAAKKAAPAPIDLNQYLGAANNLVKKITEYLAVQPFKNNDELEAFFNNLSDSVEINIAVVLRDIFKVRSDYFRIECIGNSGRIEKKITAIYDRLTPCFLYWKEN